MAVEAAESQVTTTGAVGVIVGEVDGGKEVDGVEDRLSGRLARDQLGRNRRPRLGLDLLDHSAGRCDGRAANDDFFNRQCSRRLGESRRAEGGQQRDGGYARGRETRGQIRIPIH